jgi:hypothetical protein
LQGGVTERLQEALDRTALAQAGPQVLVAMGGDEDDRDPMIATIQLALEIEPGHSRHRYIDNQATRQPKMVRGEKLLCRRKGRGIVSELSDEVRQRFPHGLIIIDD